ncbi:cupin domain-containing protein [Agromyces sp. NPDC058110]|uniref:cupin domain-containing protein n=1 Tax=Agromyces sp. NPDC058110 TaxID=3346345 RepID=UPI0036DA1C85
MTDVRNLADSLAKIPGPWQPHRLATVNDQVDMKIAKLHGEFVWHMHPETDELFLVIDGEVVIQLRDRDVVLGAGDLFVVPQGVEHCPRAEHEASVIMIERTGTVNTGDAGGELTADLRELD